MSSFVFAAQSGMGHLNPLLAIADRLVKGGHEVEFVYSEPRRVGDVIAARGYSARYVRPPLSQLPMALLPYLSGFAETSFAMRMFFAGAGPFGRAIAGLLRDRPIDCAVADFAFPGLGLAAELHGMPWASVYHAGLAYRGPQIPPFGSGLPIGSAADTGRQLRQRLSDAVFRSCVRGLRRDRRRIGLPLDVQRPYFWSSSWLTLVLSAAPVEVPRDPLPPRTFFVGPCLPERSAGGGDFPYHELADHTPKVYVSLGTVFNDKPEVFRRIIAAFANQPVQLIVSAGGAFAALQAQAIPANVLLFPRVPQVDLLPRVDAVVSHGGNNTVNETLAAGRPLLVMPVGGEQGDNASRVEWLGAGLRADLKRASAAEIREKTNRLLTESTFRERAAVLGAALGRTDGPGTATRLLARLAATRAPIERKGGTETLYADSAMPWESEAVG
ncbi:MAG: glycosyltransferase family 1 protein [Candidatus Schekmanbacteria bacterium]|nr:glycosyltransferase family 1 protein [Candidatus Schekmanbacteria bacterium]